MEFSLNSDLQENNEERIVGVVEGIVYYNEDNGYAVCYVETAGDLVTVVGYLPAIAEGESVVVTGRWGFHSEYGEQFQADYFEKTMPTECGAIIKYLSSGIIKGVRAATAEKIVAVFGEKTLNVIANSPMELTRINGISAKRAAEMSRSFAEQMGVKEVVIFFQKFGISPSIAAKVYKLYGISAVDMIKKNPYSLIRDVSGLSFQMADKIALSIGFEQNSSARIGAGITHILYESSMDGHTYLPRSELASKAAAALRVDLGEADASITSLLFDDIIANKVFEQEVIYLNYFLQAELYVAAKLRKISGELPTQGTEQLIIQAERQQGIQLADTQKKAVNTALNQKITIITGGPGTGKTTIINTIISIMESRGQEIALCAPTGRAAKRMSEICGVEAKTVHRLLGCEYSDDESRMRFSRNEENPLNVDMIIVDEMSMVDILLMDSLLRAAKENTRLVLVGDSDQLPSVGPGNVLYDLVQSAQIPVICLTEIYRQAKESMIVVNAHRINHGEMPICNQKDKDFFIMERENAEDIVNLIVELCARRLPNAYGFNPMSDIQVLTPMRKNATGVNALNERLQAVLNPSQFHKKEKKLQRGVFRIGDKVMQIRNNYDIEWNSLTGSSYGTGVFNGDVGYVTKIEEEEEQLTVLFDDDKEVLYHFNQLDDLVLAYAVTVHKSQGNEFEAVVMPLFPSAPMLQNRKLFYTAVTRAKKLVVLVGRNKVLQSFVENRSDKKRYTGLQYFLRSETL